MPTYEYRCPSGHVCEKFYPSISDKRWVKCPTCGKRAERLNSGSPGGGKQLIVADRLGPNEGEVIAFVEGREGANPYWPGRAPVDAYCSLIVDTFDYRPPTD